MSGAWSVYHPAMPQQQVAVATGTHDHQPELEIDRSEGWSNRQPTARFMARNDATGCEGAKPQSARARHQSLANSAGKSDVFLSRRATECETAGDATRTRNIQLGRLKPQSVTEDSTTTYDASKPRDNQTDDKLAGFDADLAAVVTAWPGLPEAIRAGIVAMVKAAGR